MPRGAGRFSATRGSLLKSFAIPLLLLPLTLISVIAAHPDPALSPASIQILALIYSLRVFVYLGIFLGLVYFMARNMGREEHFYRFATANNWLMIPAAVLSAPLILAFLNGSYEWSEVYPFLVFITLYSYAYSAFMITFVMRLPWEFACFVAIAGMAIHQTSLGALKWAAIQAIWLIS